MQACCDGAHMGAGYFNNYEKNEKLAHRLAFAHYEKNEKLAHRLAFAHSAWV